MRLGGAERVCLFIHLTSVLHPPAIPLSRASRTNGAYCSTNDPVSCASTCASGEPSSCIAAAFVLL
jgi:hypothetical protein